jgi:UDP-glucuronate 4-epimerase
LLEDHRVVGIDSLNSYYSTKLKESRLVGLEKNPNFVFHKSDCVSTDTFSMLGKNYSFKNIYHLAAQAGVRYSIEDPSAYLQSNIVGTFNILEFAKNTGVDHLFLASTSSAYGASREMPLSENNSCHHPMSFYAATKLSSEVMAHSFSHIHKIPTTVGRFFTVYGEFGRPDMALFKFVKAILEDRSIDLYNAGDMRRDFTYVGDIVDAVARLGNLVPGEAAGNPSGDLQSPVAPYRLINIGSGNPQTLKLFVKTIEDNLGKSAKINLLPMQKGDVVETSADTSLLDSLLPDRQKSDLSYGIGRFVDWYVRYRSKG